MLRQSQGEISLLDQFTEGVHRIGSAGNYTVLEKLSSGTLGVSVAVQSKHENRTIYLQWLDFSRHAGHLRVSYCS